MRKALLRNGLALGALFALVAILVIVLAFPRGAKKHQAVATQTISSVEPWPGVLMLPSVGDSTFTTAATQPATNRSTQETSVCGGDVGMSGVKRMIAHIDGKYSPATTQNATLACGESSTTSLQVALDWKNWPATSACGEPSLQQAYASVDQTCTWVNRTNPTRAFSGPCCISCHAGAAESRLPTFGQFDPQPILLTARTPFDNPTKYISLPGAN